MNHPTRNYMIRFKLFNLTLLLIPVIFGLTLVLEHKNESIYMPLAMTVSSFILFVNFPKLVIIFHQRPLYYDDLVIRDYNEDDADSQIYDTSFRKRYQNIFRWIITVTSPLMLGVLTEVWYMKSDFSSADVEKFSFLDPSTAAALAIMISLGTGYLKVSVFLGKILMGFLKFLKQREVAKKRAINQEEVMMELANTGITVSDRERLLKSASQSNLAGIRVNVNSGEIFP